MNIQILVTYASKYGATAEIATKIGDVLQDAGLPTTVKPVKQVKDIFPYTAVILGSAVYIGKWRKEAVKFLKTHEQELAERDVWLFSSGPTEEGDPVELLKGWQFPEAQQPLADRIQPHAIAVFHGVLDKNNLNFMVKWMLAKTDVPSGDFRDWQMITEWSTAVAEVLKMPVP